MLPVCAGTLSISPEIAQRVPETRLSATARAATYTWNAASQLTKITAGSCRQVRYG